MNILCIGNVTADTDNQCQQVALLHNIPHKGMVPLDLQIESTGCYHMSLGDFLPSIILQVARTVNKVIFLSQPLEIDDTRYLLNILKNTLSPVQHHKKDISPTELLCIGCSYTEGTGHSTHETVYPYITSRALGLTVNNQGKAGASNFRTEQVLNQYKFTHESNVIVQFTGLRRIQRIEESTKVPQEIVFDYTRSEVCVYTDERLLFEFRQLVIRVVNLLRSTNTKFVMLQISMLDDLHFKAIEYLSEYKEFVWCPDSTVDTVLDGHLGPKSNILMSKYIDEKWKSLYS